MTDEERAKRAEEYWARVPARPSRRKFRPLRVDRLARKPREVRRANASSARVRPARTGQPEWHTEPREKRPSRASLAKLTVAVLREVYAAWHGAPATSKWSKQRLIDGIRG